MHSMSHVIYKYPLDPKTTLTLPVGSQVLCAQMQGDIDLCLWILHPKPQPDTEFIERTFVLIGTGWDIDSDTIENYNYIGTVQLHGGGLVFHLFEVN